eukprot:GILI01004721.1.p1 GENE.GILI01004721.1~~GILI01004721.1.p1  ORF type:complete len:303 (+),score=92.79 GILI01004721.1:82-990(+)
MMSLDAYHPIIEDTIKGVFDGSQPVVDVKLADFDDVSYHITNDPKTAEVKVSMRIPAYRRYAEYGATDLLSVEYPSLVCPDTEPEFDISLRINCASVGAPEEAAQLATKVAHLRRTVTVAPFLRAFECLCRKAPCAPMEIPFREKEFMWIITSSDRVNVIFNVDFKEESDASIAKVFLQEFADARRSAGSAPPVSFSDKEAPMELRDVPSARAIDVTSPSFIGFITFTLFPEHVTGSKAEKSATLLAGFRNYLAYHIKASKSYLHTRMRNRVDNLLGVLSQAIPEKENKIARTITGRKFERK